MGTAIRRDGGKVMTFGLVAIAIHLCEGQTLGMQVLAVKISNGNEVSFV